MSSTLERRDPLFELRDPIDDDLETIEPAVSVIQGAALSLHEEESPVMSNVVGRVVGASRAVKRVREKSDRCLETKFGRALDLYCHEMRAAAVEKLASIRGPYDLSPSARGEDMFRTGNRKRRHVNLVLSRLVRFVRDPLSAGSKPWGNCLPLWVDVVYHFNP